MVAASRRGARAIIMNQSLDHVSAEPGLRAVVKLVHGCHGSNERTPASVGDVSIIEDRVHHLTTRRSHASSRAPAPGARQNDEPPSGDAGEDRHE
jgi:hypothetical protein